MNHTFLSSDPPNMCINVAYNANIRHYFSYLKMSCLRCNGNAFRYYIQQLVDCGQYVSVSDMIQDSLQTL